MELHLPPWLASRRAPAEEAVILLDAGGRIVELDAAAEGLAHGGSEPHEGRSFESVFRVRDEGGGELSAETRRIVLTTPTGEKRFELIAAPQDGEDRWKIVLRAHPVPLVAGEDPASTAPESAARYRALLNSVHAGFCVLRVLFDGEGTAYDYRFIEVNPAFEVQMGFENAVGKTARELVPDLDRSWPALYGKVAVTGEAMHFHQEEDALGRSYDVYAFRLGGEESRDVTLLFTDVTAHKVAEATIREAHERIATILENITDAYFGLDEKGRFTYLNQEAQRLLNLASDDLVGVSIWDAFPGLRESPFDPFYRNALAGIGGSITEFFADHNRYYEVHASPTGHGIAVYFQDASEKVRNEEERERLWQSVLAERRKLELVYAESPAFVAILRGRDLVFEYANDPYYGLIGHRDILNKPLAEALPETVAQGFPELLLRVMDTGERLDLSEMPCLLQREPGAPLEERFVSLRYLPAREADGTISGVYAHGIDVTEMMLVRRALAERVEESARGSLRKDEFLATLAHELRNPLAPIRLSAELLGLIEPEDPEFEEARGIILRQVNHMVRLVDDLLDVSRVAQGKITLRREPVDLASVVAAAVETSAPAIEAGGHALEISLPSEPLLVEGDAMRLAQVVANILNNAAKYTTHVGRIGLDVRREGDEAVVRVRDDGIGIPAEMLPRIFDMFTQVEGHLSRAQGGLGIGLTLCQRLIAMHGGSIEARSEGVGQGSEFIIRLASVAAVAAIDLPLPSEAGRAWRVLVVDDNVDGAWTLTRLLRAMGHEVHVAHGGEEALGMAEALEPEVVLLDIGLPDLSGYEVARRLRLNPRLAGVPLVAQTGWGRDEDVASARAAGFDRHLVKPLARVDLERLFAQLSV